MLPLARPGLVAASILCLQLAWNDFGIPLLFSLYLSFQGWSADESLFAGRFAGLANYEDLLSDPEFIGSLGITFGYTAATVSAELGLGLAIALLLNVDLPWIGVFRTALVVPMMITPIVAGLCWKLLLDPGHGVINYWIGQHIVWLGNPGTALAAVGVVNVWQNAPYVAVLLLAGLRSLPSEPLEAASIDGASWPQMFWHITLPLLRPYILLALLLRTIFEFRAFDNIYVMTGGGPANATMVLSMFTYLTSFVRFDFSLAAASSWLMLLMSMRLFVFRGAHQQRHAHPAGADGEFHRQHSGTDWGSMTASGVLVILPVLLFSFAAQRHLVAGLSSGAVKG